MAAKEVLATLALLRGLATRRDLDNLDRFGITASKPLGVSMANLKRVAARVGRSHELAAGLWETGIYEARMLTALVDEPARVTAAQMDRWCRAFDNWAICDTLCFHLFDRTPHAWSRAQAWSRKHPEFERRAGFALLASLALHDKGAPDGPFLRSLPWIERAAGDQRNFVKKGVSWALRAVGRRSPALHAPARALAGRLAASDDPTERWVGKDALRDLSSPAVLRRLAKPAARGRRAGS
jgi:3-methyladenine DNA glycosylase AlkD